MCPGHNALICKVKLSLNGHQPVLDYLSALLSNLFFFIYDNTLLYIHCPKYPTSDPGYQSVCYRHRHRTQTRDQGGVISSDRSV
jgi:hypothetical protein